MSWSTVFHHVPSVSWTYEYICFLPGRPVCTSTARRSYWDRSELVKRPKDAKTYPAFLQFRTLKYSSHVSLQLFQLMVDDYSRVKFLKTSNRNERPTFKLSSDHRHKTSQIVGDSLQCTFPFRVISMIGYFLIIVNCGLEILQWILSLYILVRELQEKKKSSEWKYLRRTWSESPYAPSAP